MKIFYAVLLVIVSWAYATAQCVRGISTEPGNAINDEFDNLFPEQQNVFRNESFNWSDGLLPWIRTEFISYRGLSFPITPDWPSNLFRINNL